MHGRTRARLGAVMLGLAMAGLVVAGLAYWHLSYVSGEETCALCGVHRDVERRGPFWFRSEPYVRRDRASPLPECDPHDWKTSGCWIDSEGTYYYGPVRIH